MAMAAMVPGGILVGEISKGHIRSWSQLVEKILQLDSLQLVFGGIFGVFFSLIFLWGLVWLIWTRELQIDLAQRRYFFLTGIGPWKRRLTGMCDEALKLRLLHKQYASSGAQSTGMSGRSMEAWELSLEFPGASEPLYLGEWGKHDEVMAEIAAWQEIFPRATIEKRGVA